MSKMVTVNGRTYVIVMILIKMIKSDICDNIHNGFVNVMGFGIKLSNKIKR